ncbi:MAG: hypothetical protein M1825_003697 [Sarcosagium campestre]|nr:MAG: hypothetical protein M1825_003697 [Sarcosagium campestre]
MARQRLEYYADIKVKLDADEADEIGERVNLETYSQRFLRALLQARGLESLWDEAQFERFSQSWHRLKPCPDAVPGLQALNAGGWFVMATVSNGSMSLPDASMRVSVLLQRRI